MYIYIYTLCVRVCVNEQATPANAPRTPNEFHCPRDALLITTRRDPRRNRAQTVERPQRGPRFQHHRAQRIYTAISWPQRCGAYI